MRVYLHFSEEGEDRNMTVKLTLPRSWREGPVTQLKEVFTESYNKKHSDYMLCEEDMHFETSNGVELADNAIVKDVVPDKADLYLKDGPGKMMDDADVTANNVTATSAEYATAAAAAAAPAPKKPTPPATVTSAKPSTTTVDGMLVCKHFGCNKRYKEEDNHDTHCRYHAKPPVFHETRKWWACCPKKIGYDWESFTEIPGCCVGRCTDVKPDQAFLGGSEMRAQAQYEFAPQKISAPTDVSASVAATPVSAPSLDGLAKLSLLRKAFVALGVTGTSFDAARDTLKARHEDQGAKVWDTVADELKAKFSDILLGITNKD